MTNNKKFWQVIKPFLSEKTKSRKKITLIENDKLVSDNTEIANCLNNFFSNIIKNLEIPMYEVKDSFHQNIESPTLKAVLKYRNRSSIISNFSCIDKNTVLKEIRNLNRAKASQDTDIP